MSERGPQKPLRSERGDVYVYESAGEVAREAADMFVGIVAGVLADRSVARVALAGGSTPKAMYRLLASPAFRERVDWPRVEIFFGDERCVPPDHADSNYRMAREALLDHVPLGADCVHRIAGERPPAEAAAQYQQTLARIGDPPRLDLVLLGMGPDGHTASLFPGTPVLAETRALAAPVYVDTLASWRVTLTAPVLSAAAHVLITTVGAEKAEALATALRAPAGAVPIQLVRAIDQRWLVDRTAAQKWRDEI
ncbi:MAG: 6-phosphogluconolactonase [Myxococcales bacterium]|nr:6-phosphogluconolactonase [Myxococcales bacterium]